MQDYFSTPTPARPKKEHYHGREVRQLFLAGGILILVSMPIYNHIVPIDSILVTVFVLLLALAAAITTSHKTWIIIVDSVLSAIFLIMFETYSVLYYTQDGVIPFLIRQIVAIIFLFALYYSVKTLRAMYLHQIKE